MARRSDHTRDELTRLVLDAAREIIRKEGLSALTTRKIAGEIGYTGGTLYQMFQSADDIVERVNAETLDELHARCLKVDLSAAPAASLDGLAKTYLAYAARNRKLWDAVFRYRPGPGRERLEEYRASVRRLMGLIEQAIAPLFGPDEEHTRLHEARVLWASFYGISALDSERLLNPEETVAGMVGTLIEVYVSARDRKRSPRRKPC